MLQYTKKYSPGCDGWAQVLLVENERLRVILRGIVEGPLLYEKGMKLKSFWQ